jgi:hypothetical protein
VADRRRVLHRVKDADLEARRTRGAVARLAASWGNVLCVKYHKRQMGCQGHDQPPYLP